MRPMCMWQPFKLVPLLLLLVVPKPVSCNEELDRYSLYIDVGHFESADQPRFGAGFAWTGQRGFGVELALRQLSETWQGTVVIPGDGSPMIRNHREGHVTSNAIWGTHSTALPIANLSVTWKLGLHYWKDELFSVSGFDPVVGADLGYRLSRRWQVSVGAEYLEFGHPRYWRGSVKLHFHLR